MYNALLQCGWPGTDTLSPCGGIHTTRNTTCLKTCPSRIHPPTQSTITRQSSDPPTQISSSNYMASPISFMSQVIFRQTPLHGII